VIRVAGAEQAPPPRRGLEKHSITSRVGRAIGDAVLNNMNVHARSSRPPDGLLPRALDNFLHPEVGPCRLLAMQQSGCYPDFVGDLEA
jgi:hypothetical protein